MTSDDIETGNLRIDEQEILSMTYSELCTFLDSRGLDPNPHDNMEDLQYLAIEDFINSHDESVNTENC